MKINPEFKELLSESGVPCISIIIPTHRLSPERIQNVKILADAVKRAKEFLDQHISDAPDKNSLIERIDGLVKQLDLTRSLDGIGIFVSTNISKIIDFPFPVKEKIKIGNSFDIRDLLYDLYSTIDYQVLSISKKYLRLFSGHGEWIQEIKNNDFPLEYKEEYEYSKPSLGSSYGSSLKEFERDRSLIEEVRLTELLRQADQLLKNKLSSTIPLVIAGEVQEISDFLQITENEKRIIGIVKYNYNTNEKVQLASHAWMEVKKHLKKQNTTLLSELKELAGTNMIALGIEEVWKAAKEGKGLELLVEKDFEHSGYVNEREYKLRLNQPIDRAKYLFVSDLVERIIKMVYQKKGKITFYENGELEDFGGIALILRYNVKQEL